MVVGHSSWKIEYCRLIALTFAMNSHRSTFGCSQSLGRVSTYAEHMGSLNFYRLVADHVDLDISRSRGAIAMEAVKRAVREPARTFQEVKAGFKAKVMPGCFELLSEVVN